MADYVQSQVTSMIQRGIQARRNDLDRIDAQSVKQFRVAGRTQVIGGGESSIAVTFPVTFIGRPSFSFGGELAKNQLTQLKTRDGGTQPLPSVSAIVAEWDTVQRITGVYNYVGCTLIFQTLNNPRYLWVHWHIEGKAFQNPLPTGANDALAQ